MFWDFYNLNGPSTTFNRLNAARGGILFIDEAYDLGKGQYGVEAMNTLVAAMTSPVYKGTVIIIAGYSKDIREMLERNAGAMARKKLYLTNLTSLNFCWRHDSFFQLWLLTGLKSRFQRFWNFEKWSCENCVKFIEEKAKTDHYIIQVNSLFSNFRQISFKIFMIDNSNTIPRENNKEYQKRSNKARLVSFKTFNM